MNTHAVIKTTQNISSEIEIENYHTDYFGTPFQPSEVVTKKSSVFMSCSY